MKWDSKPVFAPWGGRESMAALWRGRESVTALGRGGGGGAGASLWLHGRGNK